MQPGWCQPVRQEFTENECEALPGVAYPGVRDNRSTVNTKTGYDEYDDEVTICLTSRQHGLTLTFVRTKADKYNARNRYTDLINLLIDMVIRLFRPTVCYTTVMFS